MRSEVEHHLATAANTMLAAWNSTNQVNHSPPLTFIIYFLFIIFSQSFTSRIGESSEAHSSLQAQYSLTLQEMYDLGRHIASIKLAIKAKQAPLKVAQTRLELRSHRPNGEATKDMPQVR